jgi:hypothetical protein
MVALLAEYASKATMLALGEGVLPRGATRRLTPLEGGETADLTAIKGKWSLPEII